ncbi:MAG: 30S ribosomal protein S9 [Gemmataceae bacterium]|nr:30S ribosomal protein S9 [Gemmataceae bacterium]
MADKKSKGERIYYLGTGRRKTAVARVRICEGSGVIEINGRSVESYFPEEKDRALVYGPLLVTDQRHRVDVFVNVRGGGVSGQAGAVSQGIARALKTMFSPPEEQKRYQFHNTVLVRSYVDEQKLRERAKALPVRTAVDGTAAAGDGTPSAEDNTPIGMIRRLRDSGYLTRDARMKERKKYGKRGARRGPQFSKR